MPNWTYDPDAKDAADVMLEAEARLEKRTDPYIQGIRDALHYVLGIAESPLERGLRREITAAELDVLRGPDGNGVRYDKDDETIELDPAELEKIHEKERKERS